ncbi:glycosyltransferase [Bacillus sp. 7884-1]|uniref:glycosyltransferase n=1 Tax=Bacillus sp. 7884-1 TaxID=2021693 RepID=UPI0011550962|nr:glycosyltransferase [Bacillus sp. 7884-1]
MYKNTKKKKNILFVLPNLQGGGAEKVVLNVIRNLDKTKFNPSLFLFINDGVYLDKIPDDLEVFYALEKGNSFTKQPFKVIRKLIKKVKMQDIIVGSLELTTTYFCILAGLIARKPVVGWVHINITEFNVAKKIPHRILIKSLYPFLSKVIAVSKGVKQSVIKSLPMLKNKVHVIYNPLPLDEIKLLGEDSLDGFTKNVPHVIAVGRLTYQKSFDYLIESHSKLIERGIIHNLIILGDGEEKEKLVELTEKLKVEETVRFEGFQNNPYNWMKNSDIFVLSSRFEGFGMVIVEAMALGIPVISTDCPSGPAEVLNNGEYGVLVKSQNKEALCNEIEKMLIDNKRKTLYSKKSLERADMFNEKNIIPQIERLLENIGSK